MNPERIKAIRDKQTEVNGLGIVLYLDLPADLLEAWMNETTCAQIMALSPDMSLSIWRMLQNMTDAEGAEIKDEASRALNLFLDVGPDRQALVVGMIEGLLNTRPCTTDQPDPMAGLNDETTQDREEIRRWQRNAMEKRGQTEPGLDAEAAIEQVQSWLEDAA